MKHAMTLIFSALVFVSIAAPNVSLACSPPPPGTPAFLIQQRRLDKAISSEIVAEEIAKGGLQNTIASIDLSGGTLIRTTSGCEFLVEGDPTNQPVGTCYDFWPLIIKNSTCTVAPATK